MACLPIILFALSTLMASLEVFLNLDAAAIGDGSIINNASLHLCFSVVSWFLLRKEGKDAFFAVVGFSALFRTAIFATVTMGLSMGFISWFDEEILDKFPAEAEMETQHVVLQLVADCIKQLTLRTDYRILTSSFSVVKNLATMWYLNRMFQSLHATGQSKHRIAFCIGLMNTELFIFQIVSGIQEVVTGDLKGSNGFDFVGILAIAAATSLFETVALSKLIKMPPSASWWRVACVISLRIIICLAFQFGTKERGIAVSVALLTVILAGLLWRPEARPGLGFDPAIRPGEFPTVLAPVSLTPDGPVIVGSPVCAFPPPPGTVFG